MSGSLMNRDTLTKQLQGLVGTQQGIEAVAKWCVFFSKEAKAIAVVWEEEFTRATPEKKLGLLYLANHTIQEGRKKGREFVDEYIKVLPKAMASLAKQSDKKCRESMLRMISIWEERRIFSSSQTKALRDAIAAGARAGTTAGGAGGETSNGASNPEDTRKLKAVGSLAPVMLDVSTTSNRSSDWMSKRSALSQDLASSGQHAEVTAAQAVVASTLAALQAEVHARKKASTFLKIHLSQQEDSVKNTEEQVVSLTTLQKQLEQRIKALGPLSPPPMKSPPLSEQKAPASSMKAEGGGGSSSVPLQSMQNQQLQPPPQQQQQLLPQLPQLQQHQQSLSQMFPAGFDASMAAMQAGVMAPFPPQLPPGMLMPNFNMWAGPGSNMGPPHLPPGMMGPPPGMPMPPFPPGMDFGAQLSALTAAMTNNPVHPNFGGMPPQQPQHQPPHLSQQPHPHQQQQQQQAQQQHHQMHQPMQQQEQDLQTQQLLQQLSAGLGGMLPSGPGSSLDIDVAKLASVLANSDQAPMLLASALAAAPQAEREQFGLMASGPNGSGGNSETGLRSSSDSAAQQQQQLLLQQLMAMSDGGAGMLAGAISMAASAAAAENGGSMTGGGQQQQVDFFQQGGSEEAEAPYDPEYPD